MLTNKKNKLEPNVFTYLFFCKGILVFFAYFFFAYNVSFAQNVVLLKTSNGVLAGKVTYSSNTFADKLKLQSFCLLKKVTEGITCEFPEEKEKVVETNPASQGNNNNPSGGTVINNITNVTNIISPLTTVFLKSANGALVGKLSYESNFTNDVKVNSFCAYKLVSEGVTCEFIDPRNPLAANPDLAIRNVAPGELDTSSIWSAIGGVSNRLNNFIKTVATVNPEVRQNLQDPVIINTPIVSTPTIPASLPVTNNVVSGGTSQIVYQVIERAVPGPQGPAGPQGPQGPAGTGYSYPTVNFPGTAQFNGNVTTNTSGDISATNGNFTNVNVTGNGAFGTITGSGLASCNATTSKLVYNSTTKMFECGVDGGASSGFSVATGTINNLFASSTIAERIISNFATFTDSTTTNLYVSGSFTTASPASFTSTSTFSTTTAASSTATNFNSNDATINNISNTNLTSTNGTITNSTSTNLFSTNASITTITTTSLFANLLNSVLATITTLWGTTSNFATSNASTSNATTSNSQNSNISNTLTTNNLTATGTSNISTINNVNLNTTNITATGTTQLTNLLASTSNASTTNTDNLIGTNATLTNATTTNLYISGTLTTAQPASFNATSTFSTTTAASSTATNFNSNDATINNISNTNLTSTNGTITNSTSTNLFSTNASITTITTTSLFANLLNSVLATITTLWGTTSNFATSNASTSNATTSNAVTFNGTTGNINTINSATGNFTTINATGTSQLTNISASTTNASTTNTNNLIGTNATLTNATITTLSATTINPTNLTSSNGTFTNATITKLFTSTTTSNNLSVTGSSTLASTTVTNITGSIAAFATAFLNSITAVTGSFATSIFSPLGLFTNLYATSTYATTSNATTFIGTTGNINTINSQIGNFTTLNATGTSQFSTLLASTTNATTTNTSGQTTTGSLLVTGSTTLASTTINNATLFGTINFQNAPNIPLTNGYTWRGSASGLQEATSSLFINNNGTIGIGTTNTNVFDTVATQRPLVVQKSDTSTTVGGSSAAVVISNGDTTTSNTAQLNFAAITGANVNPYSSAIISTIFGARTNGQYPDGQLAFLTSSALNSAPSEKMRITQTGNVGIGTTAPSSRLVVSNNSTSLPTAPAATVLHMANSDGNSTRLLLDTFAGNNAITFRKANGTAAAPTAVLSSNILGSLTGDGYGTTAYGGGARVSINLIGTENWTDSANGTGMTFSTAANGTTVQTERMRIDNTGYVGIGTTTPSSILSLVGTTGILASTTATSTFQGGGINLITAAGNTGCFAINGSCLNTLSLTTNSINAYNSTTIPASQDSTATSYNYTSIGNQSLTYNRPYGAAVYGNYMYVTSNGEDIVQIYDISNASSPVQVGQFSAACTPGDIEIVGSTLYISNYTANNLRVYSLTGGSASALAPTFVTTVATGNYPLGMVAPGNGYLYVANNGNGSASTISIFNISNPSSPTLSATYNTPTANPVGLAATGTALYVTHYNQAIVRVLNISAPTAPTNVTTVAVGTNPMGLEVVNKVLLVSNFTSNTIHQFNVSSPLAPTASSNASFSAGATNPIGIAANGTKDTLYIMNNGSNNFTKYTITGSSGSNAVAGVSNTVATYSTTTKQLDGVLYLKPSGASSFFPSVGTASSTNYDALIANGIVRARGFTVDFAADLAETFPTKSKNISAGMLVAFGKEKIAWNTVTGYTQIPFVGSTYQINEVVIASGTDDVIGVVSTAPGFLLGGRDGVPVAFSGRVPVMVTNESGKILSGDKLTLSVTQPGRAMKLVGQEGHSIGVAMSDDDGSGTVLMLVQQGYSKPNLRKNFVSKLKGLVSGDENGATSTTASVIERVANVIRMIEQMAEEIASKIIRTEILCVGKYCINESQMERILIHSGVDPNEAVLNRQNQNILPENSTTTSQSQNNSDWSGENATTTSTTTTTTSAPGDSAPSTEGENQTQQQPSQENVVQQTTSQSTQ